MLSAWYRYAEADLEHAVPIPDLTRSVKATELHNNNSKIEVFIASQNN